MREMFVGLELGFLDISWLFLCLTPMFMLMVMPIATMLSVFLTFLKMGTDRELLALKASGISLKDLLPAPIFFSVLCAIATILISMYSINWGMMEFRGTVMNIATTRAKLVLRPGVFNQDLPGLTIFARQVDPLTGELEQVMVEDRTKEKNSIVIIAPHGSLTTDELRGEILFNMFNGRLYRTGKGNVSVLGFEQYTVRLSLSELFKDMSLGEIRPKEMSWQELQVLTSQETPENMPLYLKAKMEIQKRMAFPVACMVLGFFALPLACIFEGVNRQLGIALALVMFFIYYSLTSISMTLVESGTVAPFLGGWITNFVFLFLGIYLFRRALHERTPNIRGKIVKLMAKIKCKIRSTFPGFFSSKNNNTLNPKLNSKSELEQLEAQSKLKSKPDPKLKSKVKSKLEPRTGPKTETTTEATIEAKIKKDEQAL